MSTTFLPGHAYSMDRPGRYTNLFRERTISPFKPSPQPPRTGYMPGIHIRADVLVKAVWSMSSTHAQVVEAQNSVDGTGTSGNHPKEHPTLRVLGIILGVLVLCIGIYAIVLFSSVSQVRSQATTVQQEVQTLRTAIDDVDIPTVATTSNSLANHLAELKEELSGWQWSIAAMLPQYGSDVTSGRQLVDVADSLAQNVLLPAATIANDYAQNISSKGILGVLDTQLASNVAETLTKAAPAITEASTALNAIKPAHSAEINQAVGELRTPINKMAQLLDEYGTLVGHLEGLLPIGK